ncbi:MAG: SPOR domain-containing protein [bacterium]
MLVTVGGYSQTLLESYDRGELTALRQSLQAESNDPERQFLRACFLSDADSAAAIYRLIALQQPDSPLGKRCLERIRQYYYAQGLYAQAEEVAKSLQNYQAPEITLQAAAIPISKIPGQATSEVETDHTDQQTESSFSLQVGAFQDIVNAMSLKSKLEKEGFTVVQLTPRQSGTRFYVVRVIGLKTERDADQAAGVIKQKLGIKPMIIKENP